MRPITTSTAITSVGRSTSIFSSARWISWWRAIRCCEPRSTSAPTESRCSSFSRARGWWSAGTSLRHLGQEEQEEAIDRYLREEKLRLFDLSRPPLLRIALHRLSGETFQLTTTEHHAILDGWSLQSTLAEILTLHRQLRRGEPLDEVKAPALSYRDFVALERLTIDSPECRRYWEDKLAEATPIRLPRLRQESRPISGRPIHRVDAPLPLAEIGRLADLLGVPIKSVLLAAHLKVMGLLGGTTDVLTGLVANGRLEELGGERIRGLFLNSLPLRLEISGGSWKELIFATFAAEAELLPFRRFPLPVMQRLWGGGEPLFEAAFTYAHFRVMDDVLKSGDLEWLEEGNRILEETNFTLSVFFQRHLVAARLDLQLSADAGQLGLEQTRDFAACYVRTLAAMVAHPSERHDAVSLLSANERRQLLEEWQPGQVEGLPTERLDESFAALAGAFPTRVAVRSEGRELTYGELDRRANRLAHHLRGLGVGPESLVGLYVQRSLELPVAILGILKAGGAYVALDPELSGERAAFALEDAAARVLVTERDLLARLPRRPAALATVLLDGDREAIERASGEAPPPGGRAELGSAAAAYVIYTSGSTGLPKGVVVTHAQVAHLLTATREAFAFGAGDVWTLFHSYAFDFSVWEIWGALLHGGRLVIVPFWLSRSPDALYHLLAEEGVTVLNQTPSAFRQLLQAEASQPTARELSLRAVIFGGEALDPASLAPWFERHGDERPRLVNMYGITETTVHVTYRAIHAADISDLSGGSVVGRSIPGWRIHLLDRQGELVPAGTPGEIYVGGDGVARGYLKRPELTAERFVPDPWSTLPGARLYRSGDVARWRPDGDLDYQGRADQQVKVRGYRIEPREIEAVLESHPEIERAVVVARDLPQGESGRQLVAYIVAAPGRSPGFGLMRRFLEERLPAYMVPAAFVALPALPLTRNGKLDRRALPDPQAEAQAEQAYVAPETAVEIALAEIWAEVLGVERVGVRDNFFALGGDSIRSIRVLGQARKAGLHLTVQQIFQLPTIRGLAAEIGDRELIVAEDDVADVAPFGLLSEADRRRMPEEAEDAYPVSRLQAGMLFHSAEGVDRAVYHDILSLHLEAPFDAALLRQALLQVTVRHPILRTSFDLTSHREPLQIVHRAAAVDLTVDDLRGLEESAQDDFLTAWIEEEKTRPHDLGRPPLLRLRVYLRSAAAFQLILSFHHAILDGWSESLLLSELLKIYLSTCRGNELVALPPPASKFRQFVALEREALKSEESRRFWSERLAAGREVTRLPRWGNAEAAAGPADLKESVRVFFPQALSETLLRRARELGVPIRSVLLAIHCRVLALFSGGREVVTGIVTSGRPEQAGAEQVLGLFLNTQPLRLTLPGGSWRDLVAAAFSAESEMLPHRRFPLVELERDAAGALYEAVFNFVHFHAYRALTEFDRIQVRGVQFFEETNFSFAPTFAQDPISARLEMRAEYDAARFPAAQIRSILGYYERALAALAAAPGDLYEEAVLLSAAERHQLTEEWNDTAAEPPGLPLDLGFAARVQRTPQAIAAVSGAEGAEEVTFAELARRADGIRRRLLGLGARPGDRVGLFLERSVDALAGLLGAYQAGCAFVPLDSAHPDERLAAIVADCRPRVVLTHAALAARLPSGPRVVCLDTEVAAEEPVNPRARRAGGADSLAYVMYTSGSTGRPKGVMVTDRGLANYLGWAGRFYGLSAADRVAVHTPLTSDLTLTSLLAPLLAGGSVALLPERPGGTELVEAIGGPRGGRVFKLTPAHLQILNEALTPSEMAARSRVFVIGGKALLAESLAPWRKHSPGTRLINEYGPTETVVGCAVHEVAARDAVAGPVPIGRPIVNTTLFVLDGHLQPVPISAPGELYIGGHGLAQGYLGMPDLTAASFLPDPWGGGRGERLYKTGDLVRRLPDGRLEFLGRVDDQVKIRGFRIELGEVEAAVRRHPGVRDAAVVARDDVRGGRRLVAYLVPQCPPGPSVAELRGFLADRLPEYMVPSSFVTLPHLPLTGNGKVDRRGLPNPDAERDAVADPVVLTSPRTALEEIVRGIWIEVLGAVTIGIHDNFSELGGNSISATQIVARLRKALAPRAPKRMLRATLDKPTIAAFAAWLESELEGESGVEPPPIVALPRQAAPPLSFAQERLWFVDHLEPGDPAYNVPLAVRIEGALQAGSLARAFVEIVRRHEVLRTAFPLRDGMPAQVVVPAAPLPLPGIDLEGLALASREAEVLRLAREQAARRFDLTTGPLLAPLLLRLTAGEHVLLMTVHHIVFDLWSTRVLVLELAELYGSFAENRPPALPELAVQYADFAVWQRAWLEGKPLADLLDYWTAQLALPLPVIELPFDRPRRDGKLRRGATRRFVVSPELTAKLEVASREEAVTLFMLLATAFDVLLYSYSRQSDVVVGCPIAGRNRDETEGLIGFFLNVLVLRTDLAGNPTISELLGRVRNVALGAYVHQDLPFEKLVHALGVDYELGQMPLFQVWFNFQNAPMPEAKIADLVLHPFDFDPGMTKFELALNLVQAVGGLRGSFEYATDLFDAATIEAVELRFLWLLEQLAARRETRLEALVAEAETVEQKRREAQQEKMTQVIGSRMRATRRKALRADGKDDES